ncbi:helix-turn-helix transcriptional regulator [Flavobacterium sp. I3-2]|uniref:helix-turn-helix transcriptional regulator n=1 Tax=Flavobacterium sp. I3-2 TaxID=2748319 RepID=UPI0015B173C9|nr:WYL domain-containing protein [Flavobacterium sp. I3-2]
MSKNIFFSRLALIVDMFRNGARLTFDEVLQKLENRSDADEDFVISKRTFQRDIKEIDSLFGIEIACNRSTNEYYIKEIYSEDGKIRLLEAIEITSLIKSSNETEGIVFLEKRKANGTEYFSEIFKAIKNLNVVEITYLNFLNQSGKSSIRKVCPIAIKESKNRWYLLAKDLKDEIVKSFSLDRISKLDVLKDAFFTKINFDVEKEYQHVFGILKSDLEIEKIQILCSESQYRYLETLPLHQSQKLIRQENQNFIISLELIPTYDFIMEILAMGKEVKVLEPKDLVIEIKAKLLENLEQYS